MNLILPDYILKCIKTLENGGYEAYCVGGAVRDLIMGRTPNDFDLATNAPCRNAAALFSRYHLTGEKHGTVTVIEDEQPVEITTYRADGSYLDARHPETVRFVGDIETDLLRRDFTVNALAYHPERGIVDICGGVKDIENKILRAVGEPQKRFGEDALRIMRLFRFSGELGFSIDSATLEGALSQSGLLQNISAERICHELFRLLSSGCPTAINPLLSAGGLRFLGLSGRTPTPEISKTPPLLPLRAAVFCDMSGADPERLLKSLKADTKTIRKTAAFFEMLGGVSENYADFKRLYQRLSPTEWTALSVALKVKYGRDFGYITEYCDKIETHAEPYKISMLEINGDDIKQLGFEGEAVGRALQKCLSLCIEHPEMNQKNLLLDYLRNH